MTPTLKENPPPVASPRRKTGRQSILIAGLVAFVSLTLVGVNTAINNASVQARLAVLLNERTGTRLNFDELRFNIFTGAVTGRELAIVEEKSGLYLRLKDFAIRLNPFYLLIGRIKVSRVAAKSLELDTSRLAIRSPSAPPVKIPDFLTQIRLKRAEIGDIWFNQGKNGIITARDFAIISKFGSAFTKSHTLLTLKDIRYLGPKVHVFAATLEQDGFFILDLTRPGIIDDARVISKIRIDDILLSLSKRKKPWLTNAGWDEELEPKIRAVYGGKIPDDRSYLQLDSLSTDFEKTRSVTILRDFTTGLEGAKVTGSGNFNRDTGIFALKVKTAEPLPFTRLPLGQAQIRQAFDKFSLNLDVSGTAQSLAKHRLRARLNAEFMGNQANPLAGDMKLLAEGDINNTVLELAKLTATLSGGVINGKGRIGLKDGMANVNLTCADFDVQSVMRLFSTVIIPSTADCNGALTGKLSNPKLKINLTSPDAVYEFLHFGQATGTLTIENDKLDFEVASTASEVGASRLKLHINSVFDTFNQTLELHSRFEGVDVRKLLRAQSLDGALEGAFDMTRKAPQVNGKGDFRVRDFRFFGKKVGEITTKLDLKNKHLVLAPLAIELDDPRVRLDSGKGLAFDFDPGGYKFSGTLFRELAVSGDFRKSSRERIRLEFTVSDLPLKYFSMLIPTDPKASSLTGKFELNYRIYDPTASEMRGQVAKLFLELPEHRADLVQSAGLDYAGKAFHFRDFRIRAGDGTITLNGGLGLYANSELKITGEADLNVFSDYNPVVAESETPITVDVTLRDEIAKPKVYGKAVLRDEVLTLRGFPADFDAVNGTLVFDGYQVRAENLAFNYDDAPVAVNGWVATDYDGITGADIHLKGSELPVHFANGMDLVTDVDLTLKGSGAMTLNGKVNIMDGQYNRDFGLSRFVLTPFENALGDSEAGFTKALPLSTALKMTIKNLGDFTMQSNVAELEMQADLEMLGTIGDPALEGQLDFLGGEINALGVSFEDASGFAEFSRARGMEPDIHITAKREIQEYEIQARIEGKMDNLRLTLDSIPSLDRREIISILFYGQTPDQLVGERRQQFTQTAAVSQLASVLARPINKISGLDVVEVRARQEGSNDTVQRLSVGKSLSNRFNLLFTTDLGIDDPERAFELEYQIFDRFYFIVAKDVGDRDRYRLDVSYRLQAY